VREKVRTKPGNGVLRGRRLGGSRQPLKPARAGMSAVLGLILIFAVLPLFGILHKDRIAQFVNRPITKVRMESDWHRVLEAEMRKLLADSMGTGFFSFDVSGVQQKLEAHPWVARASVKRVWPDSISLRLEEEIAIALWGETAVLNSRGEIFTPSGLERLNTLPRLSGVAGSQGEVMQKYQKINELLFPSGLRLTALRQSERGSWSLTINRQFEVTVGRERVMERLQRFVALYSTDAAFKNATIESIDLRYDNGLAVNFGDSDSSELAVR